jgi:hypothetical protein
VVNSNRPNLSCLTNAPILVHLLPVADNKESGNSAEDKLSHDIPFLEVIFYRTNADNEPVREWLKNLRREDRKVIVKILRRFSLVGR